MKRLEFLRYATLGQYLPGDSRIHRLDPRIKLVAFGLIVAAVTFSNAYLANGILLLAILLLLGLSRLPLGYGLQSARLALPALVILALFQLVMPARQFGTGATCAIIWQWRLLQLTDCTLRLIVVSTARLIALLVLTNLLTFTTKTSDLATGVEDLLAPLQRIGVPAHELALTLSIALRFVPTLALQMERVVKAQTARGADFGASSRFQVIKTTRRLLPLLVPLFVGGLRRSERLALAMEARCYTGGRGRSRRTRARAGLTDYVALIAVGAFCAAMWVIDFGALDRALWLWLAGAR